MSIDPQPTICANCVHCIPAESHDRDPFEFAECRASPNEVAVNFVTGKPGFTAEHTCTKCGESCSTYFTEDEFQQCDEVNADGKCSLYEAKADA